VFQVQGDKFRATKSSKETNQKQRAIADSQRATHVRQHLL
jgi:hypothetical protein